MKKHTNQAEEYISAFPKFKKWINECVLCHKKGYRPDMPEKITVEDGCLEVHFIKKYFDVLPLSENGLCSQCARIMEKMKK